MRRFYYRNVPGMLLAALASAALLSGCGPGTPAEFIDAAKQELAKNQRPAAIIHLRNALQKNPESGEARFLLGKALLDNGDPVAAEKELRKALQFGHPPDPTVPTLARAMMMLGRSPEVIDEFAGSEMGTPGGKADLQTSLGYAYLYQNKLDMAQIAFAAALAADPDFTTALLGEARIKANVRDFAAALELAERAVGKAPGLSEAWEVKGSILMAMDRTDDARAAYLKAIETDPKNVTAHSAVVSLLMRERKIDEAAGHLDAMKKALPRHSQTLYLQASLAYAQKNYAAANEAIQLQLKAAPDNTPGLLLASAIDVQLKSYAQAEARLAKVLSKAPRDRVANRLLIATYVESGQAAKAMAALRPILPGIENDPELLALAGAVFMQNGDVDSAIAYYEKAAARDPKQPRTKTALALAHLRKGDTDRGLAELEQAAHVDTGTSADMALIASYLSRREFDKALRAIDALQSKQPGSPLPFNMRGGALIGKRDIPGARRSFEKALELDPGYFPAAANLARLDLADKKPDDARRRFEAVLARNPKSARAYLALAQLRLGARGSAEEVGALVAKAVAADPNDEAARLALIEHFLRTKDATKAVNAAQEALAALPNRPQLMDALARAHRAAGDGNQAITTYRKLAEQMPGAPMPYLRIAELQIAAKDKDGAMQSLREALARKPDYLEAQRLVVALHVDAGRLPQAIAVAREVQKQRPKQAAGFILEGDVHASQKSWNEALAAYRAGLKQVASADLAIKTDAVLRASGKVADADNFARTWLKDHPDASAFRTYLAQAAIARKDYAAAIEHFTVLVEASPDDGAHLNNLAWALGQAKDPRALEYAEKALKLAPGNAGVMDTLGVLLVEKGDTGRGIDLLRKASELAPNSVPIRLNLAKALLKAGQKDAARAELEVLRKLGRKHPVYAEVTQLMKEL